MHFNNSIFDPTIPTSHHSSISVFALFSWYCSLNPSREEQKQSVWSPLICLGSKSAGFEVLERLLLFPAGLCSLERNDTSDGPLEGRGRTEQADHPVFPWLCWAFAAALRLSPVAGSRGYSLVSGAWAAHCQGFSCCGARALGHVGSGICSSQALEFRLNCCGPQS